MASEPDDPQFNPYAPPLSSLAADAYQRQPSEAERLDLPLIDLLDGLVKDPIQVHGQIDEYIYTGKMRAERQSSFITVKIFALMSILCIFAAFYSLKPAGQVFAFFIWVMLLVGFFSALRFKNSLPPKHRPLAMKIPAGEYSWLIAEGGILVSTPGGAQWAVPWSLFDRIYGDAKWWLCQFKSAHEPQWRMPVAAFQGENVSRFQSLVDALPSLAHSHRPHPVSYAERTKWTDRMTMDSGPGWSVLQEGSVAWCDVRGLVCSLPHAEVSRTARALTIHDSETGWTAEFPFNAEPV